VTNNPRWLTAQWILSIWNPELWQTRGAIGLRRRLHYRAKGIVWHDRILNGRDNELAKQEVKP
jgi:hypothetical protein